MAATPNYSGMFLRGYGSQNHIKNNGTTIGNTVTNHSSARIGTIQGDAIREVWGMLNGGNFWVDEDNMKNRNGALMPFFDPLPNQPYANIGTDVYDAYRYYVSGTTDNFDFYASRITPIANEIRPVNMAVRYLIRCR